MAVTNLKIAPSGIPGLDIVLGGGVPVGNLVMIVGAPGTGKTTLIQHMCFAWAEQERLAWAATPSEPPTERKPGRKDRQNGPRKVIFFSTLSEPHTKLMEHVRQFDFYNDELFIEHLRFLSLTSVMEEGLQKVADVIVNTARRERASLVALDSLRSLEQMSSSSEFSRFIYQLSAQLNLLRATAVMSLEHTMGESGSEKLQTAFDTVIGLYSRIIGAREYSRFEVRKARGMNRLRGLHTYNISQSGLTVFPRFETQANTTVQLAELSENTEQLSLGLPVLEKMLKGGLPRGSTTMVAGSLGTGKTLLSLYFLLEGVRQGEPGCYLGFYESRQQLVNKTRHFGLNLQSAIDSGMITLLNIAPIELEPDQLAARLKDEIEKIGARRVVWDGLAELEQFCRIEDRSHDYSAALTSYFKSRNITSLWTYEISKLIGTELDLSNTSLALLAENLLLFRQVEYRNHFSRVFSILKMRDSDYDRTIREFLIEDDVGITILDVVRENEISR